MTYEIILSTLLAKRRLFPPIPLLLFYPKRGKLKGFK